MDRKHTEVSRRGPGLRAPGEDFDVVWVMLWYREWGESVGTSQQCQGGMDEG